MPTLRQLEYLVTVADTGSFTHAAELLMVTQPALSHQIQALERALGGPVFERLPRQVRLTPLGRAVLPHAQAALAETARIRSVARRMAGLDEGELEVAAIYSVSLGILPPVLREWRHRHPGVRIRLREYPHADAMRAAMLGGQADLAVGPEPEGWDGPVRALGVEEFVVIVAADDPLAAAAAATPTSTPTTTPAPATTRTPAPMSSSDAPVAAAPKSSAAPPRVPLTALAERDWVHFAPTNGLGEVLDRACAAAGFVPKAAVRVEQTPAALMLAATGLGPTLVPANIVPAAFDGVALLPDPPVRRTLTAYTRTRPDPVATAFTALLAEVSF